MKKKYLKAEFLKLNYNKMILFTSLFLLPVIIIYIYFTSKINITDTNININNTFIDLFLGIYNFLIAFFIFLLTFDHFYIETKSKTWGMFFYSKSNISIINLFFSKLIFLSIINFVFIICLFTFLLICLILLNIGIYGNMFFVSNDFFNIIKVMIFYYIISLPILSLSFLILIIKRQFLLYFSLCFVFYIIGLFSTNSNEISKYIPYSYFFASKIYYYKNLNSNFQLYSLIYTCVFIGLILLFLLKGDIKKEYLKDE